MSFSHITRLWPVRNPFSQASVKAVRLFTLQISPIIIQITSFQTQAKKTKGKIRSGERPLPGPVHLPVPRVCVTVVVPGFVPGHLLNTIKYSFRQRDWDPGFDVTFRSAPVRPP